MLIVFIFSFSATFAHAAFNPEINYQGKLTGTTNAAVADGSYSIRFNLYTTATGGSPVWTETWCNTSNCAGNGTGPDNRIRITNGLFSTMLGSTTAFSGVDFNQTLYLGIEIGGSNASTTWDGEMSPRKILGAVPAAFVAQTLQGLTPGQFIRSDVQNSTSTASTFLNILQTGAGKVAEFFGTDSQSVLAILSGGNVGIGTTSPAATFGVNGSGFFSNNLSVVNTGTFGGLQVGGGLVSSGGVIAAGPLAVASAISAVAFGSSTASGDYAFAFGESSTATGEASVAGGSSAVASAFGSTAFGGLTTASGLYALATGYKNTASGIASGAFGSSTSVSGNFSSASGESLTVSANNSFAFGKNFTNSAANTFKVGFSSTPTLTINSTQVGIGTTTPYRALSVYGSSDLGTNALAGSFTATTSTATSTFAGFIAVTGLNSTSTFSGGLFANILAANTFSVGTTATSTIQGVTTGTSTLQGFLNVLGTNSTSTFSGNLAAGTTTLKNLKVTGLSTSTFAGGLTVGTNQFVVQQFTGNVGIGTTSPFAKLSVTGSKAPNDTSAGVTFAVYGQQGGDISGVGENPGTFGGAIFMKGGLGGNGDPSTPGGGGGAVTISGGDGNPNTNLSAGGVLTLSGGNGGGGDGQGPQPGADVIITGGTPGGTPGGTVGAAYGNILLNPNGGNVGIGTTTPTGTLSIDGNSAFGSVFSVFDQDVNSYAITTSGADRSIDIGTGLGAGGSSAIHLSYLSDPGGPTYFNVPGSNFAIGTSTATEKLTVQGGLCVTAGAACPAEVSGKIVADGLIVQNAFDVAESYPTKDRTLSAGEIVTVDADNSIFVSRAKKNAAIHMPIIGIVSTKPGLYLSGSNDGQFENERRIPVALSGRVPLKVNMEGGAIAIGDRIALSSVDGVGRKASGNGETVGVALEAFTGESTASSSTSGDHTIQVFLNIGYHVDQNLFADANSGNSSSGATTTNANTNATTTEGVAESNTTSTLVSRVDALASTTDILTLKVAGLASTTTAISNTIAASTSATLASSTSFIQVIAEAVRNVIQSTGNWIVDKLTAHIVYSDRIEAKVAAVSQGLEMTDQATGQIYCVGIKNGDWQKTLGQCGTPLTTPAPSTTSTPIVASPVITNTQSTNSTSTSTTALEASAISTSTPASSPSETSTNTSSTPAPDTTPVITPSNSSETTPNTPTAPSAPAASSDTSPSPVAPPSEPSSPPAAPAPASPAPAE